MSLVITTPADPAAEPELRLGTFWPEVIPADMRDEAGIDGSVESRRFMALLKEAMAQVEDELAAWRQGMEAAGHASLAEVPAASIGEESVKVLRYRRALACHVKAQAAERYRDFSATGAGDKKADAQDPTIDDLLRDYRAAIADIQGKPRTVVELI